MGAPMNTGIPDQLDLDANYVIQFTALDASTGAAVTSVTVSNASLLVTNVLGVDLLADQDETAPLWLDIPNDQLAGSGA